MRIANLIYGIASLVVCGAGCGSTHTPPDGYELEVLLGCGDRLADIDAVIVELIPGANHERTLHRLRGAGFSLHQVTGDRFASLDALPELNLLALRDARTWMT